MANLIFDHDGTLHESIRIYEPAFRKAQEYLVSNRLLEPHGYSTKEISQWLGMSVKEMWNTFVPDLEQTEKDICSQMIGAEMLRLIRGGNARLYPGTEEVLAKFNEQGHRLIWLSNCKVEYMEANRQYFHLDRFFTEFYCAEEFGFIPKYQIFETVREKFPGEFIVIGDRYQDMEIAVKHHLRSIGCLYGYGEASEFRCATDVIREITELVEVLGKIE